MKKRIVIGNWEVITILINMICTKIFLNFPRKMAEEGGTAGWIVAVYISLLAFLGFLLIYRLYRGFEGKDLVDMGEMAAGGIGRVITGTVVILFLLYIISIVLREFAEDMKIISLIVSPISFVTLFFLAGMIAGAYLGLEAVARLHAVFVPIIATGFLIIMAGVVPLVELRNLLPLLGHGAGDVFGSGFFAVSIFAELIFLFLLYPFIRTYRNLKTSGLLALGFSSFFLILSAFIYLMAFPYPIAIERVMPIYQLARLINYGRFFQRIESVFVLIWAMAAFLYLAVGFYFMIRIFSKTFKLKYEKPLIPAFAIIVFATSLIPTNIIEALRLETHYFRVWAWIVTFAFSILILLAARWRKRMKDRKKEEKGYSGS